MAPTIPVYTLDITTDPLGAGVHGEIEVNTRTGQPTIGPLGSTDWVRWLFTADANCPDTTLTYEHGNVVVRGAGGTGLSSNRREAWQVPGGTARSGWRIKSLWASPPPTDGLVEHGHMHNMQLGSDGKIRAAIVWDFNFGVVLGGVWEAFPDGTGFAVQQAPFADSNLVTASSRTSNVVTVTVPTGAQSRWRIGDAVVVDLTDNTYDGTFTLTGVTDTTLSWPQTAANDADGGTGTVTLVGAAITASVGRGYQATDAARVNGVVTTTGLTLGHPFQIGDRITADFADATYDGRFTVSNVNPFTQAVSWLQPGVADDASAGAGSVAKTTPYWVESRLLPGNLLQARIWPDTGNPGVLGANGIFAVTPGPPPWEGAASTTWDLNRTPAGVTVPTDAGLPALVAAHLSSNNPVRYNSIEASPVSVE